MLSVPAQEWAKNEPRLDDEILERIVARSDEAYSAKIEPRRRREFPPVRA